jgi:hypothetical protein
MLNSIYKSNTTMNNTTAENLNFLKLFTLEPKVIFEDFLKKTKTPSQPDKYLSQTGLDINRWYPKDKMEQIASYYPEFENSYQGLVEIGRINQAIWGEDANVIGHPYQLLEYLKRTSPELFKNGFGYMIEIIVLFHDAAELYLEEDGHPRITDYITGSKSQKNKDFEFEKLKEIIAQLPIHNLLKGMVEGGCNKQGSTGEILALAEKKLFVESSKNVITRMQQLRGRKIYYNSFNEGIKTIEGETMNAIFQIAEETSTECLQRMRDYV